jgi:hypothetical protein
MLVMMLLSGAPAAARGCTRPVRLPLHAGAQALLRRHGPVVAALPHEGEEEEEEYQEAAPDRPNPGSDSDLSLDFQRQRLNLLAGFTPLAADDNLNQGNADVAVSRAAVWKAEMRLLNARAMRVQAAAEKERLESELSDVVKLRNLHDMLGGILFAAGFLLLQIKAHDEGWGPGI